LKVDDDHELQHFIQRWIEIDTSEPEAAPTLAGNLSKEFWCWYYDTSKEGSP
jgi:hypothetical protein